MVVRHASRAFLVLALSTVAARAGDGPWRRHTIDPASREEGRRGADGVRVLDANGDGRLDIATGWEEGGAVRVVLQPPRERVREPWPGVTVGRVASPEDAVLVDLDSDGAVDVVSSCEGKTRSVFVHWAPRERERYLEESAWTTAPFPVVRGRERFMYALPFDADGRRGVDLIVGSKGAAQPSPDDGPDGPDHTGGSIGWLESPEDPRDTDAWQYHRITDAGWAMSIEKEDLDGDGDLDLVVSDRYGPKRGVRLLENPGVEAIRRGETWREHALGATGTRVLFLAMADLDGDGRRDIVTAARESQLIWLRRTASTKIEFEAHDIVLPYDFRYGKSVAVGDMNGDGRNDIVMTNRGDRKKSAVSWIEYDRSPTEEVWSAHDISGPDGEKFDLIELLDLDGDGDLDVITCEEIQNLGVFWYENPLRDGG